MISLRVSIEIDEVFFLHYNNNQGGINIRKRHQFFGYS